MPEHSPESKQQTEWSPEPWKYKHPSFLDKNGAHVWLYCDSPDAHRMIACVNALAGLKPECVQEMYAALQLTDAKIQLEESRDDPGDRIRIPITPNEAIAIRSALALAKPER